MSMTREETETIVRSLLTAAGMQLTEEQIAGYVRIYSILRAGADSLYIPETRYESPALIFSALVD
jgi:hypothetical protein